MKFPKLYIETPKISYLKISKGGYFFEDNSQFDPSKLFAEEILCLYRFLSLERNTFHFFNGVSCHQNNNDRDINPNVPSNIYNCFKTLESNEIRFLPIIFRAS